MVPLNLKIISTNWLWHLKCNVDFKCNVKGVRGGDRGDDTWYTEKYQAHIPCCFAYKFVCVDNKFSKSVLLYWGKNEVDKSIETMFKEYDYCRRVIKKSILIKIYLCLKKMNKCFSQVIDAGYVM